MNSFFSLDFIWDLSDDTILRSCPELEELVECLDPLCTNGCLHLQFDMERGPIDRSTPIPEELPFDSMDSSYVTFDDNSSYPSDEEMTIGDSNYTVESLSSMSTPLYGSFGLFRSPPTDQMEFIDLVTPPIPNRVEDIYPPIHTSFSEFAPISPPPPPVGHNLCWPLPPQEFTPVLHHIGTTNLETLLNMRDIPFNAFYDYSTNLIYFSPVVQINLNN